MVWFISLSNNHRKACIVWVYLIAVGMKMNSKIQYTRGTLHPKSCLCSFGLGKSCGPETQLLGWGLQARHSEALLQWGRVQARLGDYQRWSPWWVQGIHHNPKAICYGPLLSFSPLDGVSYIQNRTVSRRGVKETGPCSRGVSRSCLSATVDPAWAWIVAHCIANTKFVFSPFVFSVVTPSPLQGPPQRREHLDDIRTGWEHEEQCSTHSVDASSPIHPIVSLRWWACSCPTEIQLTPLYQLSPVTSEGPVICLR